MGHDRQGGRLQLGIVVVIYHRQEKSSCFIKAGLIVLTR